MANIDNKKTDPEKYTHAELVRKIRALLEGSSHISNNFPVNDLYSKHPNLLTNYPVMRKLAEQIDTLATISTKMTKKNTSTNKLT